MSHAKKVPDMTAGRAVLINLMHRYLKGLLDPILTLLEVHNSERQIKLAITVLTNKGWIPALAS